MTRTPVIHVSEMAAHPRAVYIGRRNNRKRLAEHALANPYPVETLGRDAALQLYAVRVLESPTLVEQARGLAGTPLACWCVRAGQPVVACHGHVVAAIADGRDELVRAVANGELSPTAAFCGEGAAAVELRGVIDTSVEG